MLTLGDCQRDLGPHPQADPAAYQGVAISHQVVEVLSGIKKQHGGILVREKGHLPGTEWGCGVRLVRAAGSTI